MTTKAHRTPATKNKEIAYRPDIDGMRAMAVLAVVGFHVNHSKVSGGFVGVDVFFVISGFLISSIIYGELRNNTFSVIEFYVRRIRRIYPALLVILVFASIAGWYLSLPSGYAQIGSQVAGGSAFVANFVLWKQVDYLTGPVELKPLLHLWSLGIEEQFYLLFPIICLVFYRASSRPTLPLIFLFVALASMAANLLIVSFDRAAAFYMPFTRMWELFLGAGLSLYQHHDTNSFGGHYGRLAKTLVGLVGAAMVLESIFFMDRNDVFPGWRALVPCLGTVFLIWAGQASWVNRLILSSRPAVFVGLISYPLYLWHWPLLSFVRIAYGYSEMNTPDSVKLAVILASFVLAFLTFQFVEKPVRKLASGSRRLNAAWGLVVGVSLVGLFGLAVSVSVGFPSRFPPEIAMLDHNFEMAAPYREGTCFLRPNQSAEEFSDMCVDPVNGSSKPLLLLWGDSHAADLFPGFQAMQEESSIRIAQFTASSCPPIVGIAMEDRPFCPSINETTLVRIKKLKPDIVVLSALWPEALNGSRDGTDTSNMARDFVHTIRSLKLMGVPRIVIIGPAPFWNRPVPEILMDEVRVHPGQSLSSNLSTELLTNTEHGRLRELAEKSGATYVSVMSRLCDKRSCFVTTGQSWKDLLVWDTSHFTEHGSVILVQRIWDDVVGNQMAGGAR